MYNLRLFIHNKLVIIGHVLWWQALISICTTGREMEPNRLHVRDALNPQCVCVQSVFNSVSADYKYKLKLHIFTITLWLIEPCVTLYSSLKVHQMANLEAFVTAGFTSETHTDLFQRWKVYSLKHCSPVYHTFLVYFYLMLFHTSTPLHSINKYCTFMLYTHSWQVSLQNKVLFITNSISMKIVITCMRQYNNIIIINSFHNVVL